MVEIDLFFGTKLSGLEQRTLGVVQQKFKDSKSERRKFVDPREHAKSRTTSDFLSDCQSRGSKEAGHFSFNIGWHESAFTSTSIDLYNTERSSTLTQPLIDIMEGKHVNFHCY